MLEEATIKQIAELLEDFSEEERKRILEVITIASAPRILDMSNVEVRQEIVREVESLHLEYISTYLRMIPHDSNYYINVARDQVKIFKAELLNLNVHNWRVRGDDILWACFIAGNLMRKYPQIKFDLDSYEFFW